ncbi:MAG TPA: DNA polymerase III subunit gamma/tau [Ktedonobacteraceae bacterium]|nr:DNA polymerase III subunit gamma/tau [Ktedonobacteraceae bacterium]
MASQSLYRKWRSQTFDEMVGQKPIVDTLRNALTNNSLKHAYLFTGPRGTGKTTTARLLAKTVNCGHPAQGEPCNECQQCREITAGNSFNVVEIDAASNRGIDSIRELRDKVMMPPSAGKYKVYILDEAHMLTTEASNALLKTLEEPPDYAIFVLATTDVHKMLPTVISRCERHDFKRISTRQIVDHLLFVAKEEQIEVERSAAELIARTAAGGMRDALSLLDQAIAYAGHGISLAQVQAMLGVADPRAISKLITYIAGLDSPALLYQIHELSEAGADLRQVNAQVVEYWRALMLAKAGADVAAILDLTEDEVNEVQQLVPTFALEELTECARLFAQNDLVQKNLGTPQLGLELASLECIELHRRVQTGQPAARPSNPVPAPISAATPAPASPTSSPPVSSGASPVSPKRTVPPAEPLPAVENRSAEPVTRRPSSPASAAPPAAPGQPGLTLQQVLASWESVKKRTKQKSNLLGTYIGLCDVISVEEDSDGSTVIVLRASKSTHYSNISKAENYPQDVNWALSTEFGQPCKVRVVPPGHVYSASNTRNASSYSTTVAPAQPSAHREPPRPHNKAALEESAVRAQPESLALSTQQPGRRPAAVSVATEQEHLARPQGVRENKKVALSKEELGQKVQQDPVVQEIMRTFKATIKDIQPK